MATSPIYGGLGMVGGAAPPAPWWAGAASGLARNSNLLLGLGAGLLSGNLAEVPQGIATGAQTDRALFKDYTAEAKAKADENLTANWIKANRPDLAGMPTAQAFQIAMKSPIAVGRGDALVDPFTRKALFTNDAGGKPAGPFDGTSMDAQTSNILLTGDPSTPEYAYAYGLATQPKMTLQQTASGLVPIWETPQLQGIRPPTYAGNGAAPQPALPGGATAPVGGPSGTAVGSPLQGTAPKPTDQQVRGESLQTTVLPDANLLLGDGSPQNPGIFDALADIKSQAADANVFGGHPFRGLASQDYQRAVNAIGNIAQSYLYAISGQSAPASEVQKIVDSVTPLPFENPQAVAEKKARLATYVQAIKVAATARSAGGADVAPSPTAPGPMAPQPPGGTTSSGVQWSVSP